MPADAIRLGLVAPALSPDPRQAARLSREIGASGLLFDALSGGVDVAELSGSGRREFRHVLAAQDQQLIGLRLDLGATGLGPGADVDRQLARLTRVVEAAAGLAAPMVCVDLGPLPPAPRKAAPPKPKIMAQQAGLILLPESAAAPPPQAPAEPGPPPDPAFVGQVNDAMSELGRRADRFSVVLAFRSELASFASLAHVLRSVDCPWFGVDLDPVAILQDTWDLDEAFSQLGQLVRHVRGRDAIAGPERRTKPAIVGHGSVPWAQLLTNLDEAGYQGWITVDPVDLTDRVGAAAAALSTLGRLHPPARS